MNRDLISIYWPEYSWDGRILREVFMGYGTIERFLKTSVVAKVNGGLMLVENGNWGLVF